MPPLLFLSRALSGGETLTFASGHFLFESFPEPRFHAFGNRLGFDTFIDLHRLLSSVDDDEAIWTFIHVLFQMALRRRIGRWIQVIVQFL